MAKCAKKLPGGIRLLRFFYLLNAIFCTATVLVFYKEVEIMALGVAMPRIVGIAAKLALIFLPLYIFLDLKTARRRVYLAIQGYHTFFIANNVLAMVYVITGKNVVLVAPLVQMVEKDKWLIDLPRSMGYTATHLVIHGLSLFIGIAILYYISRVQHYFFQRSK